jgi:hypothetical protein
VLLIIQAHVPFQIFTAGTVTNTTLRDQIINLVVNYASNGKNNVPLSDWYDAQSGQTDGFQARPVVGGHLALVRLCVASRRAFVRLIHDHRWFSELGLMSKVKHIHVSIHDKPRARKNALCVYK